ncbi:MAG: MBL fold metallo-hydrolase [Clostridia bacterium]|nr:MBL fold metallo-hydrolase [Clostridia bacterium]
MMQLIKGNTYYYDSISSQGGYCLNDQWLIIDTGGDDSSAKKSIRAMENPDIKYIFNTHSHADHCGGNAYFEKRFAPTIIAPFVEDKFIEAPILEPIYFYGAAPPEALKNKFLYVKPSTVAMALKDTSPLTLAFSEDEATFEVIALSGHAPNMMGIITPDRVAFIGDALLGDSFLEKHALMFTYDVAKHLETLETLKTVSADAFILSHGGLKTDILPLIEANRSSLLQVSEAIFNHCKGHTITFDHLHHQLYNQLNLNENLSSHLLNRSVIRAHVQYLEALGELSFVVNQGQLFIE